MGRGGVRRWVCYLQEGNDRILLKYSIPLTPMETIRQIVRVNGDRKIEITLPETTPPGLVEIVVVLQPLQQPPTPTPLPNLFGFLPYRIDPLQFQQSLRNEWNR